MGHSSIGYGVPSFRVWCSSACMFFPSNSEGWSYPRMRAAEGLEKRQIPSESQPQIASEAESSIRRFSSSLLSRMSSVCTRNVLSSEDRMGKPWQEETPLRRQIRWLTLREASSISPYIERTLI